MRKWYEGGVLERSVIASRDFVQRVPDFGDALVFIVNVLGHMPELIRAPGEGAVRVVRVLDEFPVMIDGFRHFAAVVVFVPSRVVKRVGDGLQAVDPGEVTIGCLVIGINRRVQFWAWLARRRGRPGENLTPTAVVAGMLRTAAGHEMIGYLAKFIVGKL